MSTSPPETTAPEQVSQLEPEYPALPDHILDRIAGYIGPGLRKQMALLREAQAAEAKAHTPTE